MEMTIGTKFSYFGCSAKYCLSTSKTSKLFKFPNDIAKANIWLEKCDRTELATLLYMNGAMPDNFFLCENHFNKNQFNKINGSNEKTLVEHAIPTIFTNIVASNILVDHAKINPGESNAASDGSRSSNKTVNKRFQDSKIGKVRLVPTTHLYDTTGTKPVSLIPRLSLTPLQPSDFSPSECRRNGISSSCGRVGRLQLLAWERRRDEHCKYTASDQQNKDTSNDQHNKYADDDQPRMRSGSDQRSKNTINEQHDDSAASDQQGKCTGNEQRGKCTARRYKSVSQSEEHNKHFTQARQLRQRPLRSCRLQKKELISSEHESSSDFEMHEESPAEDESAAEVEYDSGTQSSGSESLFESVINLMNERLCAFEQCKNIVNTKLFRFPRNPDRCRAWVQNTSSVRLEAQLKRWGTRYFYDNVCLCARHFQPSCFAAPTRLLKCVVPTVFNGRAVMHPCLHGTLPPQLRDCGHPECAAALNSQENHRPNEGGAAALETHQRLQPTHSHADDEQLNIVTYQFPVVRRTCQPGSVAARMAASALALQRPTSTPITSGQLADYELKMKVIQGEVRALKEQLRQLAWHRGYQNQKVNYDRDAIKRAVVKSQLRRGHLDQLSAVAHFRARLPYAAARFLELQVGKRRHRIWDVQSIDIPVVWYRCGLPVRQLLARLFVMPTASTVFKYRTRARNDVHFGEPCSILRKDVNKKFHRRLTRRTAHTTKNISHIISQYIKKRHLDIEEPHAVPKEVKPAPLVKLEANIESIIYNSEDEFKHKKYNVPPKQRSAT